VLAGYIMDKADVGGRIVDFLDSLIGPLQGRPPAGHGGRRVPVVVHLGSKAADMATIGIPMNRKLDAHGYEPHERAALLAAAAAMAESVPPSIALILLGSSTSISTGALFIAGMLPRRRSHLPHDPRARAARPSPDGSRRRARACRPSRATAGARSCRS
jgi:TRAP-type C4-dicarboxylate transport system permease large subunit